MTGLQISIILLSISFMLFAFFASFSVISKLTENRRTVAKRVENVQGKQKSMFDNLVKKRKKPGKDGDSEGKRRKGFLDNAMNMRLLDVIFNELLLAGIMMKPEEFGVIWLVLVFVPSGLMALFSANLISSVVLAAAGAIIPVFYIRAKKKKRTELFESQLGDALVIICNCLRSGLTFQQAMDTIAREMSPPMNMEFARALNEIKFGYSTDAALNNMADRLKSADLMLAVSAVSIQRQTGGNLSEILESISQTIKDRFQVKTEINALTSQGRLSGMVIGLMPVVVSGALMVINPGYMSKMFETGLGKGMLAAALVLEIIGFVVIKKIITIKY